MYQAAMLAYQLAHRLSNLIKKVLECLQNQLVKLAYASRVIRSLRVDLNLPWLTRKSIQMLNFWKII